MRYMAGRREREQDMKVMAIDPGLNALGVCVLGVTPPSRYESPRISALHVYTCRAGATNKRLPSGRTLQRRVQTIVQYLKNHDCMHNGYPDLLVVELPQVYQGYKQEGDPNDLIKLAVLVGACVEGLAGKETEVLLPLPAEWKGQIPKEVHHRRIRKRLPNLGRQSKDALDAVGLALYGLEISNARSPS